jgi:hypothetical protein
VMSATAPKGANHRNDNAALASGVEGLAKPTKVQANASPKTKKWQRVLTYLASGRSLNRFEAERVVNDHCLHSSISGLERDSGIAFDRRFETVPCLRGTAEVRVKRYWLRPEPENIRRARAALGLLYDAANGDNEVRDE